MYYKHALATLAALRWEGTLPDTAAARKVLVQVRLSEELVKDVDHLSVEWGMYRNETMEKLLREALETYQKQGRLWSFSRP